MVIILATSLWTLRSDSLLTLSQILQVTAKAGLEEVVCFPPPGRLVGHCGCCLQHNHGLRSWSLKWHPTETSDWYCCGIAWSHLLQGTRYYNPKKQNPHQSFAGLGWPSVFWCHLVPIHNPSESYHFFCARFVLPAVRPVKVVQELPVPWPRCVKLSESEIQREMQEISRNDIQCWIH